MKGHIEEKEPEGLQTHNLKSLCSKGVRSTAVQQSLHVHPSKATKQVRSGNEIDVVEVHCCFNYIFIELERARAQAHFCIRLNELETKFHEQVWSF